MPHRPPHRPRAPGLRGAGRLSDDSRPKLAPLARAAAHRREEGGAVGRSQRSAPATSEAARRGSTKNSTSAGRRPARALAVGAALADCASRAGGPGVLGASRRTFATYAVANVRRVGRAALAQTRALVTPR